MNEFVHRRVSRLVTRLAGVLALLLLAGPLSFYGWYVYSESARQIDADLRDLARTMGAACIALPRADARGISGAVGAALGICA